MTNEKRDGWLYHAGIEELRDHVLDLEDQIENLHELLGEEMQKRRELEQELAECSPDVSPPGLGAEGGDVGTARIVIRTAGHDSEQYSVGE